MLRLPRRRTTAEIALKKGKKSNRLCRLKTITPKNWAKEVVASRKEVILLFVTDDHMDGGSEYCRMTRRSIEAVAQMRIHNLKIGVVEVAPRSWRRDPVISWIPARYRRHLPILIALRSGSFTSAQAGPFTKGEILDFLESEQEHWEEMNCSCCGCGEQAKRSKR